MKTLSLAFVAVLLCLASLEIDAQVLKRTTTKTEKIPLGAGSTVAITGAPVGAIKVVQRSGGDEVDLTAEIEVQAINEADLAGAAVLTGYITQESLGRLAILTVGPDSRRKFTSEEKKLIKRLAGLPYTINYTITVPPYTNIEINAGKGQVDLEGGEGSHRINAVDSKVNVSIKGGSLAATVAKGELHIHVPPSGRRGLSVDASVVSGNLSITLPDNFSGDVDAGILRTGKIFNENSYLKKRDRKVPFSDKLVQARGGVGGPGIKLTVGDGNIWLNHWVE